MRNDYTINDQINLNINVLDFLNEDIAIQKERLWQQFYYFFKNNFEYKNLKNNTLSFSVSFKNGEDGIKLKVGNSYQFLNYKEIVKVEASNNYTMFYTTFTNKPLLTSKTLKFYTANLLKHHFVKLHRAHIVNPLFIKSYCSSTNELQLTDGSKVKVARRRKKNLVHLL